MIVYRDRKARTRKTPVWLIGATDLVIRENTADQNIVYYGIGSPILVGDDNNKWTDIGDGYDARIAGDFAPYLIVRDLPYVPLTEAEDMHKRSWYVPQVLNEDVPLIIATYDDNYLPTFDAQQTRMIEIAKAARAALYGGGIDLSVAARWAAELLCAANHINDKALLRLNLLDNALVLSVMQGATGCQVQSQREAV